MAAVSRRFPSGDAVKIQRATRDTEGVVERNLALVTAFTKAVISDPLLGAEIPKGATLVLLPDDDPELAAYNTALGERARAAGRTIYVQHIHGHEFVTR